MSGTADRRPGPFPQRVRWQGRKTLAGLVMAAVSIAALVSGNRYFLGGAILLMGLLCLGWAWTRSDEQLRDGLRYTRGSGWWLGWLVSKAPGAAARVLFTLLCVAIVALGVVLIAAR